MIKDGRMQRLEFARIKSFTKEARKKQRKSLIRTLQKKKIR